MSILRTAVILLALGGCTTASPPAQPIAPGAKYVAMGSSYAAGPGIPSYYEDPPAPCARSTGNYAHQIAQRHQLALTDVSCSGATTAHLTGPRDTILPQLEALTPDTRLVTITIGGNDLGYIGRLTAASCLGLMLQVGGSTNCNTIPPVPTDQAYAELAARMDAIAKEVTRRSPQARVVFVDYLAVLPEAGTCPATPLSSVEADLNREIARRLAAITRQVAYDNKAGIVTASEISKGHDACSNDPWMNGYPRPGAPVNGTLYHPNAKGMTAIADALEVLIWK